MACGLFPLAGGKVVVQLAVYKKVEQDATRAPQTSVGPPLNGRIFFDVNEDISGLYKPLPLLVAGASADHPYVTGSRC